ncbi:hypothetical protein SFUMM280S_06104 [Streptomyces fumanus]
MAAEVYLYFNLLFYHPIELAIGEGVSSISYSMGSYETKCSRGCRPRFPSLCVGSSGDPSLAAELELVHRFDRIDKVSGTERAGGGGKKREAVRIPDT